MNTLNRALFTLLCTRVYEQEETHLCDDLSQARVAHDQPAPGCDAVGLILKLFRVCFVEILEPEEQQQL